MIQAAVCRCSQPLSGFSGRCQEDEMMLQAVMKSNPGSDYIYVVDTRPKVTLTPFITTLYLDAQLVIQICIHNILIHSSL